MLYYLVAFVALFLLFGRKHRYGWKRLVVAFLGGAAVHALLGWLVAQGAVALLAGGLGGEDGPASAYVNAVTVIKIVDAVIGVGIAAAALRLARPRPGRETVPVGAGEGVPVPATALVSGSEPASAPAPSPAPPTVSAPVAPPAALDATAAETLRVLLVGLADPALDVRQGCAALMVAKFVPALDHEPDPDTRRAAEAAVRTLAAEARGPQNDVEARHLAHAVALYTRLTAPAA